MLCEKKHAGFLCEKHSCNPREAYTHIVLDKEIIENAVKFIAEAEAKGGIDIIFEVNIHFL